MTLKLHLSPLAEADIDDILLASITDFGLAVSDGYAALIRTALLEIVVDPEHPGSHPRPELGRGIRAVPLRISRDRVGEESRRILAPAHAVFYRAIGDTVHVSRVLHEARDFSRHSFP